MVLLNAAFRHLLITPMSLVLVQDIFELQTGYENAAAAQSSMIQYYESNFSQVSTPKKPLECILLHT